MIIIRISDFPGTLIYGYKMPEKYLEELILA